ncbi:MAG: MCP four helix bundle domain-containing protein, partial [Iodobacter sp.]
MLAKFTIAARLASGFALLLFLLICVGAIGLWGLNRQSTLTSDMLQHDLSYSLDLIEARHNATDLRRYEKDIFLNFESPEKTHEYDDKWHKALEKTRAAIKNSAANAKGDDTQKINELTQNLDTYANGFNKISDEIEAKKYLKASEINAEFSKFKDPVRNMQDGLTKLADEAIARAKAMDQTVTTLTTATISVSVTLVLFAVLLGI